MTMTEGKRTKKRLRMADVTRDSRRKIMKYNLSRICQLFTISVFLVLGISAQSTDSETDRNKEANEVTEFIHLFYKNLWETKDIRHVPKGFFVSDFKTRFARRNAFFFDPTIANKLSEEERYEFNASTFNVFYLGLLHLVTNPKYEKSLKDDDAENDYDESDREFMNKFLDKFFPPDIVKVVQASKHLTRFMERTEHEDNPTIQEVSIVGRISIELKNISFALRTYLNNRELNMKVETAIKNLNDPKLYGSESCSKDDCYGFPEKTKIIGFWGFPLEFKLMRQNGQLKILDISMKVTD